VSLRVRAGPSEIIRDMRKLNRSALAGALLAGLLLMFAFALSASAAAPLKITNCYSAASRPKTVVLTCGDANTALKGLAWSSFGGSTAQGKGTFVTNNCEPNCASGKNLSYPVKVKATGSVSCKHGLRVYAKLTLQFTGKAPGPGVPRTWKLGCPVP
jgi:hypothetical protein